MGRRDASSRDPAAATGADVDPDNSGMPGNAGAADAAPAPG
jgi:hypothetical protein